MIAALNHRLALRDAVCDYATIYMDGQPIVLRPKELSDHEWIFVCFFMCGEKPTVEVLEFAPAPTNDFDAWGRLETYMKQHDANVGLAVAAEPRFRRKGRR